MMRRIRLGLRLWGYLDYVRFFPGGFLVALPWDMFFSVEAFRAGGFLIEVFGSDERWPEVYWDALFSAEEVKVGEWYCPENPREWVEMIAGWMKP